MDCIRVLLVDDHAILRAGLRALIKSQPDMDVVGDAGDASKAIELCGTCNPNVVILDLAMPGGGGLQAIDKIRSHYPQARVLVLTMHDDLAYLRSSLAAGAAGYLVKRAADEELLSAIRTVYKGRSYIDVALADSNLRGVVEQADINPNGLAGLSQREREVLELVAYGYTNREIASRLHVSPKSIETYRSRVLEKLGLKTRADLVRFALEMGVVRNDVPSQR